MSRASRKRMREAKQAGTGKQRRHMRMRWLLSLLVMLMVGGGVTVWLRVGTKQKATVEVSQAAGPRIPTTYGELCALPTTELARCDIALMNLLCAEGLRGSEDLNITNSLGLLVDIARQVKSETDRHLYRFRDDPAKFNRSEGYFRMMMLTTVLQQDLGIHYNPARANAPTDREPESNDRFYADSKDVFIHGLTRPSGTGTCASLPVFSVAIGRRLGYPLKLVRAKAHLFVRWDEGDRSFNVEATSVGGVAHPDDYYRTWPFPFTAEEQQSEGYLQSLTPVQELATFLTIRGQCCRAMTNWPYAVGAFA